MTEATGLNITQKVHSTARSYLNPSEIHFTLRRRQIVPLRLAHDEEGPEPVSHIGTKLTCAALGAVVLLHVWQEGISAVAVCPAIGRVEPSVRRMWFTDLVAWTVRQAFAVVVFVHLTNPPSRSRDLFVV